MARRRRLSHDTNPCCHRRGGAFDSDDEASAVPLLASAIQACAVDKFLDLLDALNLDGKKEQLQQTCGPLDIHDGSFDRDPNRVVLSARTTPILHAARMGNPAMFSAVLAAMKTNEVRKAWQH